MTQHACAEGLASFAWGRGHVPQLAIFGFTKGKGALGRQLFWHEANGGPAAIAILTPALNSV